MSESFDTIARMFYGSVERFGSRVLMRQKELGIWKSYTWTEVATIVEEIGMGLLALRLEAGETVSILSNTCREWVWSDLATLAAGGVSSGIYPTDAAPQVGGVGRHRVAEHLRPPGRGAVQTEQHAQERGLAGPVGAEQPQHAARFDRERHVVERDLPVLVDLR